MDKSCKLWFSEWQHWYSPLQTSVWYHCHRLTRYHHWGLNYQGFWGSSFSFHCLVPGNEVCSQHERSGDHKKIYGNKPSIHTMDAVKNTGVIRKKIWDNLISHLVVGLHGGKSSWETEWKQTQKWHIEEPHCQEHWDSSQQPDPESFSGDGVSPPTTSSC